MGAKLSVLEADPTRAYQWSDDGFLVFWRDAAGGGREGLACTLAACARPECGCRDVELAVTRVDGAVERFEFRGRELHVVRAGQRVPCQREFLLALDCMNGEVAAVEPLPDEGPRVFVAAAVDGPLLEFLWRAFLRAKGTRADAARSRLDPPLSTEGTLRALDVFFMNVRPDFYVVSGREVAVLDLYCVAPGCPCEEAVLDVFEVDAEGVVGTVTVPFVPSESAVLAPSGPERADLLDEVWRRFAIRHDVLPHLRERRARVRAAHARHVEQTTAARVVGAKVGRNDPCPCGSGRKYKVCCLR